MADITEIFQNAIGTGEIFTIKYHGGSQPGRIRQITPQKITGNKLYAYCVTSKSAKSFLLDKIEMLSDSEKISYEEIPETLEELYSAHVDEWRKLGYNVSYQRFSFDSEFIGIFDSKETPSQLLHEIKKNPPYICIGSKELLCKFYENYNNPDIDVMINTDPSWVIIFNGDIMKVNSRKLFPDAVIVFLEHCKRLQSQGFVKRKKSSFNTNTKNYTKKSYEFKFTLPETKFFGPKQPSPPSSKPFSLVEEPKKANLPMGKIIFFVLLFLLLLYWLL
jgi:hypothetical protein